jgi:WD40 repeat protein
MKKFMIVGFFGVCAGTLLVHAQPVFYTNRTIRYDDILAAHTPQGPFVVEEGGACAIFTPPSNDVVLLPHSVAASFVGGFSPNGSLVAGVCPDKKVRIWRVKTGECKRELDTRLGGLVKSVNFSPCGKKLASLVCDGDAYCVELWDVVSGGCSKQIYISDVIVSARFSFDGKFLIVALPSKILVYDLAVDDCVREIACDSKFDFSIARQTIVRPLNSGGLALWDIESGKLVRTLSGCTGSCAVLSPSQDLVVTGRDNGEVCVHDGESGDLIVILQGLTGTVECIEFTQDGTFLMARDQLGNFRVWNRVDYEN